MFGLDRRCECVDEDGSKREGMWKNDVCRQEERKKTWEEGRRKLKGR